MSAGGPQNQRAHVRVRPSPRAPIEVQIMGDGFLDLVRARDLSVGGVSVFIAHDFVGCNLENRVDLVISLPHEKPFMAQGVVRHRTAADGLHSFGVQFTHLTADGRRRIEAYVKQRVAEGGAT
ncbi:MAG: PilZ domain-containing protein [Polyangiales bacterium]